MRRHERSATKHRAGVGVLGLCVVGLVLGLVQAPAAATPHPAVTASSTHTAALKKLRALVAKHPRSYTSVAVFDFHTGAWTRAGATSGMICASIAKVQLLESLLLERQRAHRHLSNHERALAARMIEHSDNSAADAMFSVIGGRRVVLGLQPLLGLNSSIHHLSNDNRWGLTTTSSIQEGVLLKNLVQNTSPLSVANRRYAVTLMRHVESDQRWGVPVVADKGTSPAVKNGWVAVIGDHYRWAVNSIGLVTVHKHQLAVAVMTQHGGSYSAGISRVQALVRAAASAAVS